jgi:Protein of unknown function (DUF1353)
MSAMHRFRLLLLLFLSALASQGHAQSFGKFVGTVQTEWLDNDDRKMRLIAPFSYVDPNGVTWTAPAGWVIDGASIPVFAWSVIGGPFNGRYRDASVIHDVACDQKVRPWEMVHEAFYWAMMASGVEAWRAKVMYAAVYHFGPRWPRVVTVSVPPNQTTSAEEQALAQAEPGSNATVVAVRPAPSGPGSAQRSGPRLDKIDIKIDPPEQTLQQQDFENLKERIIEAEGAKPAPKKAARARNFSAERAEPPVVGAPAPPPPIGGAGGGVASDRNLGMRRGGNNAAEVSRGGVSLAEIRSFKPAE